MAYEFAPSDYAILALTLFVSACIGIFYGCCKSKITSTKEILFADREMTVFPTAMSLLASFMSGISVLGTPAEVYQYGTMFIWSGVAYTILTIFTSRTFLPLFYNLQVTSAFEYLERRFNKKVKLMASSIFILHMTTYMGMVLYAPALALHIVTDLDKAIIVILVAVVCTFYTTIGGMKAVMWTDVFQTIVMLIGLILTLIIGVFKIGSISKILEINWQYDRLELLIVDFNPTTRHTVWSLTIGSFFYWSCIYPINQSQVQRYLSVPNIETAKRALYWNLAGLWLILIVTMSIGLTIFATYYNCDPLNYYHWSGNELYPFYVMDKLKDKTLIPGLFLSCLLGASMSTISSGLNSLAAVTLEDFIKGLIVKDMSEENATMFLKLLCVVYGIVCLGFYFIVDRLKNLLQSTLSIFGIIGGPLFGLFCLGVFCPFSNTSGAFAGTFCSLMFSFWLFIGCVVLDIKYPTKPTDSPENYSICFNTSLQQRLDNPIKNITQISWYEEMFRGFHSISYTWYGMYAVAITVIVGSIVSLLTGRKKPNQVDSTLIIPLFTKLFPFLPKSFLKLAECGFNYDTETTQTDQDERSLTFKITRFKNRVKIEPQQIEN